jgi:predicted transcriptional regulator
VKWALQLLKLRDLLFLEKRRFAANSLAIIGDSFIIGTIYVLITMASADILQTLGNKYSAEILDATDEPISAQELSDELGIPIATCYRRIDELTEHDLLELHDNILSDDRRRIKVYRRSVDEVRVDFEEELTVHVEERSEITNKLDEAWRTLSES